MFLLNDLGIVMVARSRLVEVAVRQCKVNLVGNNNKMITIIKSSRSFSTIYYVRLYTSCLKAIPPIHIPAFQEQ
jgi:hypothetical protein